MISELFDELSSLQREKQEAERLRLVLDGVVLWLRGVNPCDISPDAWLRLRNKVSSYRHVEVTPEMCGLAKESTT